MKTILRTLAVLCILALPSLVFGQGASMPFVPAQFFGNDGRPLNGGRIYTYANHTTTPLATYSVVGLTAGFENPNPIVLDSSGRPPTAIFFQAQYYTIILRTSTNVLVKTQDDVGDPGQIYAKGLAPDNIRKCDRFPGSDAGAKIAACIADLPSTGGTADATAFEGVQVLSSTITLTTGKAKLLLGGIRLNSSQPIFALSGTAEIDIQGIGRDRTILNYTGAGRAVSMTGTQNANLAHLTINGADPATGIYLYSAYHTTVEDVALTGFPSSIRLTGPSGADMTSRTFDTRITDVQITAGSTTCGICIDHAVDTYVSKSENWDSEGNPTAGWNMVVDTGASGVYLQDISMVGAGFKIQNSTPSALATDLPPEFLFADQIVVDTVTGHPAWQWDSSLSTADAGGRKGKSYHVTNSWAAFTQTNAMSGVLIAGGEDISLTDFRSRLNRYHGIQVTGGNNIRIINPSVLGNNQQNSASISGITFLPELHNFQVIGGVSGNNVAGETGHQKYGVLVSNASSSNYTITGVDTTQGNETHGIFDGGTGPHITCGNLGDVDNSGGTIYTNYCRDVTTSYRHEMGDGNNFEDFNGTSASNPVRCFDAGDCWFYNRAANTYNWNIGSSPVMSLGATALDAVGFSVGGAAGVDATLSCPGGQAVKAITVIKGIVTGVTCGAP